MPLVERVEAFPRSVQTMHRVEAGVQFFPQHFQVLAGINIICNRYFSVGNIIINKVRAHVVAVIVLPQPHLKLDTAITLQFAIESPSLWQECFSAVNHVYRLKQSRLLYSILSQLRFRNVYQQIILPIAWRIDSFKQIILYVGYLFCLQLRCQLRRIAKIRLIYIGHNINNTILVRHALGKGFGNKA